LTDDDLLQLVLHELPMLAELLQDVTKVPFSVDHVSVLSVPTERCDYRPRRLVRENRPSPAARQTPRLADAASRFILSLAADTNNLTVGGVAQLTLETYDICNRLAI
ncbi:MAG: hypothetical protein ACC645_26455, partial [Pirellulales bacterium]